jgi:hypothetical protein
LLSFASVVYNTEGVSFSSDIAFSFKKSGHYILYPKMKKKSIKVRKL